MVSYDQAVHFLEKILRMPATWRELLQNDSLEFLTVFLRRHAIRIPFQNIEMAAKEPEHRWFPSEYEYIEQGMTGRGGCCTHINYFNMMVLRAIGLDSFVVRGDHYHAPVSGTHCILMVKLHGPKNFGVYMVETGGYFPILEPIPMDKEKLPFKTLQAAGFPYEFREFAPGWIGKFHIGGGIMGGKFTDKEEVLRTSWNRQPRALWEFDYPMLETFTNPEMSTLLKLPTLYRFFNNTEFRRLFPKLPENVEANKGKVLTTTRKTLSQKQKPLTINGKPKPQENGDKTKLETKNSSKTETTNLNNGTTVNNCTTPASTTAIKPTDEVSEEEYEVVTEDEETGEDDLEYPQNFVYVWKRRIVVGDAKSRKVVKNYNNWEEMGKDLKKYFPMIPSDAFDKAFESYSKYEVEANAYDSIL